jgi:hypothetical protein
MFLTIGGVLVLRPLTKRLGSMLEANAENKRSDDLDRVQHEHLRAMIESQNMKIEMLEQRIEFSESLLEARAGNLIGAHKGPRHLP